MTQKSKSVKSSKKQAVQARGIERLKQVVLAQQQTILDMEANGGTAMHGSDSTCGAAHPDAQPSAGGNTLRVQKKALKAYELITGLRIEISPEQTIVCSMQKGQGGAAMRFELDLDEEAGEVEYSPLEGCDDESLPECFHDVIHFGSAQTPHFYKGPSGPANREKYKPRLGLNSAHS